jgi:phosphoesterase RecJ-like protein
VISLSQLAKKIACEKNVALFVHVRPDGDTLGSAFALKLALESLRIRVEVYSEDSVPERFSYLGDIVSAKNDMVDFSTYSALIAIDCADITRLGNYAKAFTEHNNTFVIDHHISNTRYAKYNYVVDNASNCENVFALINELGVELTEDMANLLIMGIMTDTGNFRHKNVTAETLAAASRLKAVGADINKIYYHMFSAQSKERAKLFGMVMSKIRYFEDGKLAVATVRLKDFSESGARQDETEGFIDFVMGIDTVKVGIALTEMDNGSFKASMRSKGPNVSAIAGVYGGGGHVLASGCQIFGDYYEVVDKLVYTVSQYMED